MNRLSAGTQQWIKHSRESPVSQPLYQPMPQQPVPAPRRPRRWPWILGIAGAFLVGIIIGAAGAGSKQQNQTAAPPTGTQTQAAAAQPAPTTTQTPAPPPKPAGPLTQFGDGKYLIGTDVAAGSYKSTGPRPGGIGMCYWARLKDDSGNNIIANEAAQGPTRVTVKAGEYLQITGCDFTKA